MGLVVTLSCIHLLVHQAGGPEGIPQWYQTLGLSRQSMGNGALWQCLSHPLLHASFWHLAANLVLMGMFGPPCEEVLGRVALVRTWGLGAIGGGLAHLAMGGGGILVGSSGLVCATMVAYGQAAPTRQVPILRIRARNLGAGILIGSTAMVILSWLPSLPEPFVPASAVGHACHLGGALAGYWSGRISAGARDAR